MQLKPMQKLPQSSSSRPSGPIKTEFKSAKSDIKSYIALSLLVVGLAAGGLYASKSMMAGTEVAKVTSVNKAELVKSILALSDDDYHFEDLPSKQDPYLNHDHNAPNHQPHEVQAQGADRSQASVSHQAIQRKEIAKVDPAATDSIGLEAVGPDLAALQEEERLNAERTEANSLQLSSNVESHHQALSQAAEEKRVRAREAIRIEREKHKQMALSQVANPTQVQAQVGLFDGVLTKCRIPGHDVHWINHQGMILQHELVNSPLTGNALAAREWINKLGPSTVVMVYKKGYEVYDGNGNLIETGNKE
jgi:hypothetical protein